MTQRLRRDTRYPAATIAAYGPDASFATKLVVSILTEPDSEPVEMRKWQTTAIDVRNDPAVTASVEEFLSRWRVRERFAADRIIGCPHEEAIDYPLGRNCPQCPFWAGRDRFTHELLTPPPPVMSADEVLAFLAFDRPKGRNHALASADAHRAVLVDRLVASIESAVADPEAVDNASLFCVALYLLAKWREPRAYRPIVRWLSLPGEAAFDLTGDIITEDGARILASVCDGDLAPIRELVLNRDADSFARQTGALALSLLAAWAEVPRGAVVGALRQLIADLEREPGPVWCGVAVAAIQAEAPELFPDLRRACDDGLIDPQFMRRSSFDEAEAMPSGAERDRIVDEQPPIRDVIEDTAWWPGGADDADQEAPATLVRAAPKVGRNDPCPCGSGKKYKKCCGQ